MNTLAIGEQTREFYRRQGELRERERILELVKSFWCGEPGCTLHSTDWVRLLQELKGENK